MWEVDLARRPRSSFIATQKADVVFALAAAGALELKFLADLGIEAAFPAMPCTAVFSEPREKRKRAFPFLFPVTV